MGITNIDVHLMLYREMDKFVIVRFSTKNAPSTILYIHRLYDRIAYSVILNSVSYDTRSLKSVLSTPLLSIFYKLYSCKVQTVLITIYSCVFFFINPSFSFIKKICYGYLMPKRDYVLES